MSKPSKQSQLQICYPDESKYFPVEAKEVICVGISQDKGASGMMGEVLSEGMINDLIPRFSTLPYCNSVSYDAKTPKEGSDLIIKRGIEKKLNTVVIPSVDIASQMMSMLGSERFQFSIGILTSVPEGKEPQVFLIEGVGQKGGAAVRKVIRVKGGGGCFIATACYGSYLHPEVIELRRFRDDILISSTLGLLAVKLYYRISPPLAKFIVKREWLINGLKKYVFQPLLKIIKNL